jgi:hypothetical protein
LAEEVMAARIAKKATKSASQMPALALSPGQETAVRK